MDKMFRALSIKSSSSYSSSIVNSSENNFANIELFLNNWSIPQVSKREVYKYGSFEFKSDYLVKTKEKTFYVSSKDEHIQLLSNETLKGLKKKYECLHFGLVQVAVKSLVSKGFNVYPNRS